MKNLELKPTVKSRLAVGLDYDDKNKPIVGILWVPWLDSHEHEHIFLRPSQAKKLRDWLNGFLDEVL